MSRFAAADGMCASLMSQSCTYRLCSSGVSNRTPGGYAIYVSATLWAIRVMSGTAQLRHCMDNTSWSLR